VKLVRTMRGYRPLTFVPGGLLLAKGYELFVADLECTRLSRIGAVPCSWTTGTACASRLSERILRLGVRLACRIRENAYLLAERSRIWMLELPSGSVQLDHVVGRGVRPLLISNIEGIDGFDDCACYGEYGDNETKEPVNIWVRSRSGIWRVAYTFPAGTIEHVHGLIPDKRRGLVWILTGDLGASAGIWIACNNFAEVSPVLVGKQDFRCCWLAFWGDRIIYATDSHFEPNSIRELILQGEGAAAQCPPGGARSEFFVDTSGSSIYACMVQDELIFSTTVEPGLLTGRPMRDLFERRPGPGIKGTHADLMIGAASRGFSLAGRWNKDWLPSRLCEFGSISFPTGTNPGNRLYAYFTALSGIDGSMGIFELH
jgi:hypothetical protein